MNASFCFIYLVVYQRPRADVSRMLEKLLGIEMDFAINDAVPCE